MPVRRVLPRRLLPAVAVVAAPSALAMLVLVFEGAVRPLTGLLVVGFVALCLAVLIRQHLVHLVAVARSEEHTSELQSLMRISYAVFCLKKKTKRREHSEHGK